tara:strand:+ start:1487 stop:1837 length:351 start_codon:yes stop_codon:yes gene_type:complete
MPHYTYKVENILRVTAIIGFRKAKELSSSKSVFVHSFIRHFDNKTRNEIADSSLSETMPNRFRFYKEFSVNLMGVFQRIKYSWLTVQQFCAMNTFNMRQSHLFRKPFLNSDLAGKD